MRKLSLFLILILITKTAYSSDYHQNDQSHRVVYVITDTSGNPVSGQTVRLAVERSKDGLFLDFNDNTFKSSGWTTRLVTMNYDSAGEHYYRVISIDNGALISGDIVCIVSNDDATYGDMQAEVVSFDRLEKIVKINR